MFHVALLWSVYFSTLYSLVVYLYVSRSRAITLVREERGNLSAVV